MFDPVYDGPNLDIFTFIDWEWCIYQLEECPTTKRHHYQCAGRLRKKSNLKNMLSKFNKKFRGNLEVMRGSLEANRIYCSKEESRISGPWEDGVMPDISSGKRTDLDEAVEAAKDYEDFTMYAKAYPKVFIKHNRALKEYWRMCRPEMEHPVIELRPWQKNVVTMCEREPDDRKVYWFYDEKGGAGKSILGKYLRRNHGAFYWQNSKTADFAYAYEGQRIVVFDFTRTLEEHVNYGLLESVKNGMIVSTKYESTLKDFKSPWLLVMANFQPNVHKLSEDRWVIINSFN